MPISSFSNPIPDLVNGLLEGHALGLQIHRQRQQDQAFKTQQILANQQMDANTIMQQMNVQKAELQDQANSQHFDRFTNPVQNGMVQDRMNATMPGNPGSPGAAPGEASTVYNLPTSQGPSLPTSYDYMRKADPSRTVDLKNYQGKVIRQGETKTPDQQQQFDRERDYTMLNYTPAEMAGSHLANRNPYIPNKDVASYLNTLNRGQTSENNTQTRAGASTDNNIRNNDTRRDNTDANNTSKEKIVDTKETGANSRTAANNTSKEKVGAGHDTSRVQASAGNNAATIGAANIRAAGGGTGTGTPGQIGVQSRFEQRRKDIAQKAVDAIQTKENALHAERLQLGMNPGATGTPARALTDAKLGKLTFQIGAAQVQKAKAAGTTAPPKELQDSMQEGKEKMFTSPDGKVHNWIKKDGIVYFVK